MQEGAEVTKLVTRAMWQFALIWTLSLGPLAGIGGLRGLRALRRQPNFPHKTQMEWGARWFWAVMVGPVDVGYLLGYLAARFSPYVNTALVGTTLFLFVPPLMMLLPWQARGVMFSDAPTLWRRKPFDLNAWLARMERGTPRWLPTLAAVMLGLTAVLWVAIPVRDSVRIDREMIQWQEARKIGAQVQRDLALPHGADAAAFSPRGREGWSVKVYFPRGTANVDSGMIFAEIQSSLSHQHRRERWTLELIARPGVTLARGSYEPEHGR